MNVMANYLLRLDQQRSVQGTCELHFRSYPPYGALESLAGPGLGFCGEQLDTLTACYPLGNGHRFYSPHLRRFIRPDSISPFGRGGINAYAYCEGDPINRMDPSGMGLIRILSSVFFGASGAAGELNMITSRMRAVNDQMPLLNGRLEPRRGSGFVGLQAFANTSDANAYMTSALMRYPQIRGMSDPTFGRTWQPTLEGADLGRSLSGLMGFTTLPSNIRHEFARAHARGTNGVVLFVRGIVDAHTYGLGWRVGRALVRGIRKGVLALARWWKPSPAEDDLEAQDTKL